MSYYVITQVKVEHDAVVEALIHAVVKRDNGDFALADGKAMETADIASLIYGADKVFVGTASGPGEYDKGDRVVCASGTEVLISVDDHNVVTQALAGLPRY